MMGIELGQTVMSLYMGPLGVLQPHSTPPSCVSTAVVQTRDPNGGMLKMQRFLRPTCCRGLRMAGWDLAWQGDVMLVILNSRN